MTPGYQPLSARQTFDRMLKGEEPYVARGDFLDDWRRRATPEQRLLMAREPVAATDSPELVRWASYLAAAVEALCLETATPVPPWVGEDRFFLTEPWFLHPYWKLRPWVLATTPGPFRRRNIFGGENMLDRI